MLFKRRIISIVIFAFVLANISLFAQPGSGAGRGGTIVGKILDAETKQPLSRANVNVVNSADSSVATGAMTDKSGSFEIANVRPGSYFVKVNYVGYSQFLSNEFAVSKDNRNIDLKTISLQQSSTLTDAVEVTAEKQMIEYSQGKKIFNVDKNIASAGGTAIDILKNIPSISVDVDGNVSLRGSSSMRVLVNGKPTSLDPTVLFETMPAASVESIEIITNPSARYDAEGMTGIINLVLKKNREEGLNGLASLNIGTSDKYSFSLNTAYQMNGLNLFANYDYGARRMSATGNSYRETRYERDGIIDTTIMDQDINRSRNHNGHTIRAGFDYDLTDQDVLSMSGLYRIGESTRRGNFLTSNFDASYDLIGQSQRGSKETGDGPNMDYTMNYRHNFGSKGHEITFDFNISKRDDFEDTDYDQSILLPIVGDPFIEQSSLDDLSQNINLQTDYVYPFGDYKIEAGAKLGFQKMDGKYIHFYQDSLGLWIDETNKTNHFVYDEEVAAAYSIFSGKMNLLSYQIGIRAEQSIVNTDQKTTNIKNTREYFDFFPSFSLSYKLTESDELQLNYSRRINRPRTHFLNPFTDYSDPNNLRSGNPNLKPEYVDAYEIGYIKNFKSVTITPTLFYRKTTDKISYFAELVSAGVFNSTFANLAEGTDYGLEFNASFDFFKWMRFATDFSYYRTEIKGASPSLELDNNDYSWSLRANANFYATKELTFQVIGNYTAPTITAQGERYGWNSVDIASRYDIWDRRATITFRLSDVFNQSEFGGTATSSTFNTEYTMKRESRVAFIGFQYKINEGPKQKERRKQIESGGADFDEF